jgi:hypothetical protein
MGSITIAGWIAHFAFWVLLVYGWIFDELHRGGIALLIGLWLLGRFGLPILGADGLFLTWVAVIDIAMVFIIFKGDIPLT